MSKNLKSILCILMTLALCAGAAACGSGVAGPDADPTTAQDSLTTTTSEEQFGENPAEPAPGSTNNAANTATNIAQENTANVAAQVTGVAAQSSAAATATAATTASAAAVPSTWTAARAIQKGGRNPEAKTFTWLDKLPVRPVVISDPTNSRGLPVTKIEHGYGAAQNGVVHNVSKENQAFFDKNNYAAIAYDNKSTEKTLYLTFDSGYENGNTAIILDVLKEKKVPAAFFCTVDEMSSAPAIVTRMINEGHIVGNHSVNHPHFSAISRTEMAKEIIEADNYLRQNFGYSAPFFRFPYGEYNESALDAVGSLGFTSVFWSAAYRDWITTEQQGAQHAFDMVMSRIHPGCVLLLHSVSSDNAQALGRIIDQARADGYVFRHLTALPSFRS